MVRSSGSGRWVDILWLLVFGAASSVWCVTAAGELGATFDEPLYLNAGLTSWRTGSNKLLMSAGTMPLAVDVQTLPIYLWEQARGTEFHSYQDIQTLLPVARATNLVFWWILLVYALRLGRTWGGAWGGRISVGLIACDPNFLGHASLATTDIAVVGGILALAYHFHHGQERGWIRRVLVPGLCYGLATLAKASGMVFGAQVLLVLGAYHLAQTGALTPPPGQSIRGKLAHLWHASFRLRKDLCVIALIGFTLVFAYTGSDWDTEWTFIAWADGLPDGILKAVMIPVSHNLAIFPNAGEGLIQQIKHNLRGHGTYILGEWHPRAYWAYFPLALTMKIPVPLLALLLGVALVRRRELNTPVGWVTLALFVFSLNCRVQIGIRFMFTLMAVAYIAVAVAVARGWAARSLVGPSERTPPQPLPQEERGSDLTASTPPSFPGKGVGGLASLRQSLSLGGVGSWAISRWFVGGVIVSTAATSVWVWPHGLSYFNQLWGGPEAGFTRLHDSNYDWGQGLPELKAWHEANGEGRSLAVWYYGTDPAILFPPFRWTHLSFAPIATGEDVPKVAGDGYLAVSVGILYGNTDSTPPTRVAVDWLQTRRPIARTHTFAIYDLRSNDRSREPNSGSTGKDR